MATLLFTAMTFLVTLAAARLALILMPGQPRPVQLLGALGLFPVLVQLEVLASGSLGHFTAPVMLLLSALLCAATFVVKPMADPAPPLAEEHASPWTIALAAALAAALVFRLVWLRQSYTAEDLSFHALVPGSWVQNATLALVPANFHAFDPLAPATLTAWLMLPFHNDGLTALGGLYWLALLAVAAYTLARGCRATPDAALLAAIAIALTPNLLRNATLFGAPDVAGLASLLAATALLLTARSTPRGMALCAGALAGYACGASALYVPLFAALLVVLSCRTDRAQTLPRFALAGFLSGGYFYARSLWHTGKLLQTPLFGPTPSDDAHLNTLAHWLSEADRTRPQISAAFWAHLDWPLTLGVVSATGLLLGLVLLLHNRARRSAPAMQELLLLLFLAAIPLVCYPIVTLATAPNLRPEFTNLLPAYALGLLLVAIASRLGGWARGAASAWLALGILLGLRDTFPELGLEFHSGELIGLAGAGISLLVCPLLQSPRTARLRSTPVLLVALVLLLLRLGTFAEARRDLNTTYLARYGGKARPVGPGWRVIAESQRPHRVALFGIGSNMAYPLLGRTFQNTLVPTDSAGQPVSPLLPTANVENPQAAPALIENLVAQKIDLVFVSRWDGHEWPPQYVPLDHTPRVKKLYDDGYSAIFELLEVGAGA